MEPWEKVLISDPQAFQASVHGHLACTECHGGSPSSDKEIAHESMQAAPSAGSDSLCGECHADLTAAMGDNLHVTQQGYWTVLQARSAPEHQPALETMFGNHCASCHTTCGDCHVSQPRSAGGGFIDSHLFQATPSMTRNCTACHGSRVGNEYLGKHEGLQADVHFREGRMNCVDCHTGEQLHGLPSSCDSCHPAPENDEPMPADDHRYAGMQAPRCETCHTRTLTGQDGIEMHAVHGGDLSCQVCHSIAYSNCESCHVAVSETSGNPFFSVESTTIGFFIGRNPRPSYERPYEYVPLRHVPISADNFEFYGPDLLPNFDALPTWVYATPHNIQLETPQSESCNACHGNANLFLTADKVDPLERNANQGVILDMIPEPIPVEPQDQP